MKTKSFIEPLGDASFRGFQCGQFPRESGEGRSNLKVGRFDASMSSPTHISSVHHLSQPVTFLPLSPLVFEVMFDTSSTDLYVYASFPHIPVFLLASFHGCSAIRLPPHMRFCRCRGESSSFTRRTYRMQCKDSSRVHSLRHILVP